MELKSLTIDQLTQKCQSIIDTLPLANYLRVTTIKVVFDETAPTSYFNPYDFEIHIALSNIANLLNNSKCQVISKADLEKHCRNLLYHEISHAILTPKDYKKKCEENSQTDYSWCPKELDADMANIIEDERIETILKHYYYGVNFRKNITTICEYKDEFDFKSFVFNALRFRCCKADQKVINDLFDNYINRTKKCNAQTAPQTLYLCTADLVFALKNIYDNLLKQKSKDANQTRDKDNEPKEQQPNNNEEKEESNEENESQNDNGENEEKELSQEEQESQSDDGEEENEPSEEESEEESAGSAEDEESSEQEEAEEDAENSEESSNEDSEEEPTPTESENELEEDEVESIMSEAVYSAKRKAPFKMKLSDYLCNKDTKCKMLKIIGKNVGFGQQQSQVQYGYSGKFNAKRYMKDVTDTYKWFEKKAFEDTGRNAKKTSKKTLNIWLDNSGSFRQNDEAVNKIMKALQELENERTDFKFNLITFSDTWVVKTGNERLSTSGGSTFVPFDMCEYFKKVNETGNEYNIFLTDGDIQTCEFCERVIDFYSRTGTVAPKGWTKKALVCSYTNILKRAREANCHDKNMRTFNNKKTIIISDFSNQMLFDNYCKNALSIIYSNDYVNELDRNIVKALDLLF